MDRQQKGKPSRSALPATEQKLNVVSFAHRKIEGGFDPPAKVGIDVCPLRMRAKPPIELFQERHNRIELLGEQLVRNGLRTVVNLSRCLGGTFSFYQSRR